MPASGPRGGGIIAGEHIVCEGPRGDKAYIFPAKSRELKAVTNLLSRLGKRLSDLKRSSGAIIERDAIGSYSSTRVTRQRRYGEELRGDLRRSSRRLSRVSSPLERTALQLREQIREDKATLCVCVPDPYPDPSVARDDLIGDKAISANAVPHETELGLGVDSLWVEEAKREEKSSDCSSPTFVAAHPCHMSVYFKICPPRIVGHPFTSEIEPMAGWTRSLKG